MNVIEKKPFPTASPESLGIPSRSVSKFLNRILDHKLNLHSLIVIRRGAIAAEGYWAPFDRRRKHRMFSISKSFVSLAVGRMIDEGKMKLDDTIASFFPEKHTEDMHPWLAQATVRDMLVMADCHSGLTYWFDTYDWAAAWFDTPPDHMPGMVYSYNTSCTQVLSSIVERLSGMKFLTYLRPVFDSLGVSEDIYCIETPDGASFGGSGVMATPRDLAKVAQLFLNGGKHAGQRLVGEEYIRQATSKQIDNALCHSDGSPDIEHRQGYGYQVWRTRNNGFCFYGMGCQLAVCLPDKDLIVVVTADTQGTSPDTAEVLSALWETLYCDITDALPEDPAAWAELRQKLDNLSILTAEGADDSPTREQIDGKTFIMADNPMGLKEIRFDFAGGRGSIAYVNNRGAFELPFGIGKNIAGTFPETHYSGRRIGTPKNAGYETHVSAAWRDAHTLGVLCHITDDYLGTLRINAAFKDEFVTVLMDKRAEDFLHDYHGIASGRMNSMR